MRKKIAITIGPDATNGIPMLTLDDTGIKIGESTYSPLLPWHTLDEFIEMLHECRRERHKFVKEDT